MIPRSGNLILRLHQRAASPHVRLLLALWGYPSSRIVIPSAVEGSLLLRLSCSLCSSVCMKHRIPQCSEKTVFPFPFTRIHRLTANEKDFSLTLEMTVRESGILALLPSPCRRALVRGYGSPSFLWKAVPRRGGDWLTQRNKKEWVRNIFSSSSRA